MTSINTPDSTTSVIFRIGLVSAGGLFIHLGLANALARSPAGTSLGAIATIILSGGGLLILVAAGLQWRHDCLRWVILAAYVCEVIFQSYMWIQYLTPLDRVVSDAGLYTDLAGDLLQRGYNPYTWDYGGTFELYREGQEASTPVLKGAPESPYPYPALPFLLVTPFQLLGLPGALSLSIVAHIAVLVLVFIAAPRRWQPVVLLPTLMGLGLGNEFTALTLIGIVDIVWVLALIGMLAAWRHWKWRAILYGLAISIKQSPALLAPFLLIHLWRESPDRRFRHVAGFVFLAAATFLLINGPFILWNPTAWFLGYTEPVRDNQIFLSQGGLSTLTQVGIAYLPKSYFLVAMLSIFGLWLYIYRRHYDSVRDTLWMLPGFIMWFSYRSLVSYWLYWAFPMILVSTSRQSANFNPVRQPSWKPTLITIFVALAALSALGVVVASPTSPMELDLQLPFFSTAGRIDRLTIVVGNHSQTTITPRFAVQSARTGMNPLPWLIESGPLALQPGEKGTYQITSDRLDRTFYAHEAVQIVVTDAGGDYRLRGVLTIEPDRGYLWPDAIPNPEFRLWDTSRMTPTFWSIVGNGAVEPALFDDKTAVRLVAREQAGSPQRIALANNILFPNAPFGVWVAPPRSNSPLAYGLEILAGEHKLWMLFGARDYTGPVDEGTFLINRFAPENTWTYQEVDLSAAFAEAGWSLPPLQQTLIRDLFIDARRIDLRLLFISNDPGIKAVTFGPIQQGEYRVSPQRLMAETFDDPAAYYQRLAETYLSERNTTLALAAYQRALDFDPGNSEILARLDWLKQQIEEEP